MGLFWHGFTRHLWNPSQKGETFHQEPVNTIPFFDYNFQVEWDTLLGFIHKWGIIWDKWTKYGFKTLINNYQDKKPDNFITELFY